jgi:hypothetical protein
MINLRESLGVAVNSGTLAMQEDVERAIDRVAALGLSDELGSLLWRLKYGDQWHYHELNGATCGLSPFSRIALRLEHWLSHRDRRWKHRGELFPRFVRLVLADWLHDKCVTCHGRGMLGVDRATTKSVRIRCPYCNGRGYTLRTTAGGKLEVICRRCCGNRTISVLREIEPSKPRPCPACDGLGVAVLTPAMWANMLGVSTDVWLRYWEKPMLRLRGYLASVDCRTHRRVKEQLGRD